MSQTLIIYYATVTGNAEGLAFQAEARAQSEGWSPRLKNLSEVKSADLGEDQLALFIVSTWGDGEPPDDASHFWQDLRKAPLALAGMRYAVFGLGDSDYAEFNAFARNLDERLAALGARRLVERVEADVQFENPYAEWESSVFPLLKSQFAAAAS